MPTGTEAIGRYIVGTGGIELNRFNNARWEGRLDTILLFYVQVLWKAAKEVGQGVNIKLTGEGSGAARWVGGNS